MGGKEKPYVFSSPGAHCCLIFCRQTFKGFFLFCIAGVAYREGRIAVAGWRADPTPTSCSAGLDIQALLCVPRICRQPRALITRTVPHFLGAGRCNMHESACVTGQQHSPAGTEGALWAR